MVNLLVAFGLFSPDERGVITRENFEKVVNSINRSLGKINFDSIEFIQQIFNEADTQKRNQITLEQYRNIASKKRLFIQSLGLISGSKNTSSNKVVIKRGSAITFGHSSWDLSYHMMLGIRIAV